MCQANNHGWQSIPRLHRPVKSHYCTIIELTVYVWRGSINLCHEMQSMTIDRDLNQSVNHIAIYDYLTQGVCISVIYNKYCQT